MSYDWLYVLSWMEKAEAFGGVARLSHMPPLLGRR